MAQRRMFSPNIIDSDAFLDMSVSARELYFQLGMRADDDGFIGNPKRIMRTIGSSDDDMKMLLAKRFVLIFENGVIVIKHWRINNLIRKDWYKETIYKEEKASLGIKDNGSYTDLNNLVNENATIRSRRLGKVRLGKVRLGKVRLGKVSNIYIANKFAEKDINFFINLFQKVNPSYKILFGNKTQRAALERMLKEHGVERMEEVIGHLQETNNRPYAPRITTPFELEKKMGLLIAFLNQEKNGKEVGNNVRPTIDARGLGKKV